MDWGKRGVGGWSPRWDSQFSYSSFEFEALRAMWGCRARQGREEDKESETERARAIPAAAAAGATAVAEAAAAVSALNMTYDRYVMQHKNAITLCVLPTEAPYNMTYECCTFRLPRLCPCAVCSFVTALATDSKQQAVLLPLTLPLSLLPLFLSLLHCPRHCLFLMLCTISHLSVCASCLPWRLAPFPCTPLATAGPPLCVPATFSCCPRTRAQTRARHATHCLLY